MKNPLMIITLVLALSASIQAAVPNTMNYQGRLTDDQGQPVTNTVSMTFTIYDAETGGNSKWTETHPSVSVIDGLFSVVLGQGTPAAPIEDTVFTGPDRWLEIIVGGETIIPRTKLASSPYSLQAGWTLVGNVLFTSGEYGIARSGNTLSGQNDSTHVNLGVGCETNFGGDDDHHCTISGGRWNATRGDFTTVCGGETNRAFADYATAGGGDHNYADGQYCTISGGKRNYVSPTDGHYATIGGGTHNEANEQWSTVCGGYYNRTYGAASAIAGGRFNQTWGDSSFIGGGSWNRAIGTASAISGGFTDTADGDFSMIPGGYLCKASGRFSFAGGRNAKALHDGSFVWADTTDENFESTGPNQFHIRATGGVEISDELRFGENIRGFFIRELESDDPGAWSDFLAYDGLNIGSDSGTNRQMLLLADGIGNDNVLVFTTSEDNGDTWVPRLSIDQDGDVGIGTTAASQKLHVEGDICYTGNISACSDARYKRDVRTIRSALTTVEQLRGVAYHWRKDEFPDKEFDDGEHTGFIAQEIKDILPNVVTTDDNGYMSVDYSRITPLLVEAVKELKAENEAKESDNQELRAEINMLKTQVANLTTQIDAVIEKIK